ncbi:uncharacterized protein LOC135822401 isoform X1 [Sycon ciliatum]|uniref:uncharacterized protein LOC135822401 isoform X1 n=1 Tax=Sycon ciliatum TaxID=27933 RepID=UPI0031F71C3B
MMLASSPVTEDCYENGVAMQVARSRFYVSSVRKSPRRARSQTLPTRARRAVTKRLKPERRETLKRSRTACNDNFQTARDELVKKEQFDQALVCLEDLTKMCKGLYTYAKKRFAIEKDYAKSLQKLTRSTLDATLTPKGVAFQGGLNPAWHTILQSTQECAEMKLSATANLEHSVLASLSSVFEGELQKGRKELSSQGHQSAKNLQDVVQLLHKAQTAYVSGAQDWQSCLLQLHRELGGEWRTLENTKQRDKEAGLSRKCEEAKQSYLAAIRQANNTQHLHHFDQMPPLLTQLSELSEDIVLVARQSLVHLLEQAELLQRSVAKQMPRVPVAPALQAVRGLDPKSYTDDFIFCHMTTEMVEPPRPFVFEEFLMEDDAAHLFFQKSRHECIQAFPSTATLESNVIRQIDNDGFFVSSESLSQVAESDRDEMRRRMTTSTDTVPVPNSRSSVTYMLALRKAVMQTKGTPEPQHTPTMEESGGFPTWFPRRRTPSTGNLLAGASKHIKRRKDRSETPERQEVVREVGRSSWFVPEDDKMNGDEVEAFDELESSQRAARMAKRSASEGDLMHSCESTTGGEINPYASVDNFTVSRRLKPKPMVPPRPTVIKKRAATASPKREAPPSSPPPPPPPAQAKSAAQSMSTWRSLDVVSESDDLGFGDKFPPPPLPGEEGDVYTVPTCLMPVGSPGSASFMPSDSSTAPTAYLAPLPYLIQVCVQYLHGERALKEEGLFRVSGDITRIRQLKAAFDALENNTNTWSSGRSLATFLEEEINKERDPNTVAGLLKMYMREQNYIDGKQCRSLVDAMYPNRTLATLSNSTGEVKVLELAMREKLPAVEESDPIRIASIRTIVREEMSPVAQSILSAMCRLLAKVAKQGEQNRMTGHSLGMCCGLSVFPAMSTGHASSVLRFMLNNWKEIFTN